MKQKIFLIVIFAGLSWQAKAQLEQPARKQVWKDEVREQHQQFLVWADLLFSGWQSQVQFQSPDNLLGITFRAEEDLGLPGNENITTVSALARFSPTSGIYARYYGVERSASIMTQRDYAFLGDTLPTGTGIDSRFTLKVLSVGYLLSVLPDPDKFVGVYVNVFMSRITSRVNTDLSFIQPGFEKDVALPQLGILVLYSIRPWLQLEANAGFFSMRLENLSGSIYDLNLALIFRPVSWAGIRLSYQEFDSRVAFPQSGVDTRVDYHFRGPAMGIRFNF